MDSQKVLENQEKIINLLERILTLLEKTNTNLDDQTEKITAIHKHVPFVDWLCHQKQCLTSVFSVGTTLRNIGLNVSTILDSNVVQNLTNEPEE